MATRYDQLDPDEEVIAGFYHHPIVYLKSFLIFMATWGIFFVVFFLGFFLRGFLPIFGPITLVMALAVLLFGHHIVFVLLIEDFTSKFILTSKHLIYMRFVPFLEDYVRFLDISEMHKFEKKKQGIFKILLNYGDVTSDVAGPVVLDNVAYPSQIITLIEAVKGKKDLHEVKLKRIGVITAPKYRFLVKGS